MSTAEQKAELHKIVEAADEETTGRLIELVNQLAKGRQKFSTDEVVFFENRAEDFISSGAKGYTAEESLALLKKRMK